MSKHLRTICPFCEHVLEFEGETTCPKCKNPVEMPKDGYLQIYRMGSIFGMAVGFGIYINGKPYGHIANKETVRIALPKGNYMIHFTQGMSRWCKDMMVEISPTQPVTYLKVKMNSFTGRIVPRLSTAEEMPLID